MNAVITPSSKFGSCDILDNKILFTAAQSSDNAFFEMNIRLDDWENDAYIMMPACAYDGNKFEKIDRNNYPPMYTIDEIGVNRKPLITDLPALNPDGSGSIEVTSGDMAVPCVGVFYKEKKEAFFIFTLQEVKNVNIGFTISAGNINISFPKKQKNNISVLQG